ncbi:hypothetical protein DMC61_11325 [Amycolatopsis sp. WAC 04169]|uniref:LuxR C-terminal-related transcriptional regulator n=1 Tax=Amycolatopsis sp. WAC 04169 TaxID=2203197 RepID=UPI000F7847B6|nr:LuxR C-terminal-related transcriptional regulator [Amycolatopsis sp. WAC 04169]RSN32773.1 hypothetical protein DMC61_11325 [Amycolatopsis sp. WAC 04169]
MRQGSPQEDIPVARRTGVRDEQREELLSAVRARTPVVLVEGPEGAGKSFLTTQVLSTSEAGLGPILTVFCGPESRHFAYHVVRAILGKAGLAVTIPPNPRRDVLFPEIRRAFDGLANCLVRLEDVHWADAASLDLLRFVLRDPPPRFSVLATRRSTGGWASSGSRLPGQVIALGPLEEEETAALAARISGKRLAPGVVSRIHSLSGGLPVYVEPILDVLARNGQAHSDERLIDSVFDHPLPSSLVGAVAHRLGEVTDGARRVLEAAALLQEPETVEALALISGLPSERVRAFVRHLLWCGHLVETGGYRYGFHAELDRLVVYEAIPGPQRQKMHQRATMMLDARDPRPMRRLVHHARRSGQLRAWLAQCEQATADAVEVGDSGVAMTILRAALTDDSLSTDERVRAVRRFCSLAPTVLDQERNTRMLGQLLRDTSLPRAIRAEVRLSYGLVLVREAGGIEQGRTEIELAIPELRDRPDLTARGMALLCAPYLGTQPISRHLPWLERAERTLEADAAITTDLPVLAGVLGARAHIGDPVAAERLAPYLGIATTAELRHQLARAHCNLADGYSWVGDAGRAQDLLHTGLDLATGAGASYVVGTAEATQIRLDWAAGRWERIDERAGELEESYPKLFPVVSELKLVKAWYAMAQGNWSEARRNLRDAGLADTRNSIAPVAIAASGALIHSLLAGDSIVQASRQADQAIELVRRKEGWTWSGEVIPSAVQAYLATGRDADADRLIADAETALEDRHAPLAAASLLAARAYRTAHLGGNAAEEYETAAAAHTRIGHHYRADQLTEQAALHRWHAGDSGAKDHLRLLAEHFDAMGATIDAGRCQRHLRAQSTARARIRDRRSVGGDLSPREEQVEQLVIDGQTNQEIADILFLSRRTIEEHVANVLRKRGVRSRHDLRRQ